MHDVDWTRVQVPFDTGYASVGTMNRQRNRLTVKVPWLIELAAEGTLAVSIGAFITLVAIAAGGRGIGWW